MTSLAESTRPLGSTGLNITCVGMGGWGIGGSGWWDGWPNQSDSDSLKTLEGALELGINWIDTAAGYGFGRSEALIGRVLAGLAERPYVFTKCGLVWSAQDRMREPRRILTPESIRKEIESSLRRLGIERIVQGAGDSASVA